VLIREPLQPSWPKVPHASDFNAIYRFTVGKPRTVRRNHYD